MKIIGVSKKVSNQDPEAIGTFWQEFLANNTSALIPHKTSSDIFCLYTDYEGDHLQPYKMIIGHAVSSLKDTPAEMEGIEFDYDHYDQVSLPTGTPQALLEAWQQIWGNGIPRAYRLDFQHHKADGTVDIFVEYKK